jgi:protein phosphatase
MGGAQAGEVASEIAVEEFKGDRDSGGTPEEQLAAIARAGNRKIFEMAKSNARQAGMGTTLVSAIVGEHDVAVGHVGDSRLYLMRAGKLQQLTNDHSLVEEFVRQGRLTREQADKHPQRSVITRALGPEEEVDVDTFTVPAKDGDVFLLCSDGLSTMLSDDEIRDILAGEGPASELVKLLVDAANDHGGRDNITAVLFKLEDDGQPDSRRTDTEDYETIAGSQAAPTTDQIEAERQRVADMETQARAPQRASPVAPEPPASPAPRPRRAKSRRGRWLLRTLVAVALLLALAGGGVYVVSKNVWFLGTNDDGEVTLYRGLPYDLPLGLELYQQRYVSGIPALSLPAGQRERVLDHQLRSHDDAADLIRSLDQEAAP